MESDWETDPLVRLEKAILPVLSHAPIMLCRMALADAPFSDINDAPELAVFELAEHQLRTAGAEFLDPAGISLAAADAAICHAAADRVAEVQRALRRAIDTIEMTGRTANGASPALIELISTTLPDAINTAMDTFRRVFLETVLKRQQHYRTQAAAAVRQLADISETIFFIGINASVEAARVGDHGRGFNVISEDIRRLASNARESTANLRMVLEAEHA